MISGRLRRINWGSAFVFQMFITGCWLLAQTNPEAETQVKNFWANKATPCGQSTFSIRYDRKVVTEYKNWRYSIILARLTEADRLNGTMYKGVTVATAPTSRSYSTITSSWEEWNSFGMRAEIPFVKKNGVWNFDNSSLTSSPYGQDNFSNISVSCSEVAKITALVSDQEKRARLACWRYMESQDSGATNVDQPYWADLNFSTCKDEKGNTPLMLLARNPAYSSDYEAIKYALSHGADPNAKNNEGKTGIDIANEAAQRNLSYKNRNYTADNDLKGIQNAIQLMRRSETPGDIAASQRSFGPKEVIGTWMLDDGVELTFLSNGNVTAAGSSELTKGQYSFSDTHHFETRFPRVVTQYIVLSFDGNTIRYKRKQLGYEGEGSMTRIEFYKRQHGIK